MVGIAEKLTVVPAHIVLALPEILTDGVNIGLTVILNEFDVAVVGLAHVAFEVITQVTASPFANADEE